MFVTPSKISSTSKRSFVTFCASHSHSAAQRRWRITALLFKCLRAFVGRAKRTSVPPSYSEEVDAHYAYELLRTLWLSLFVRVGVCGFFVSVGWRGFCWLLWVFVGFVGFCGLLWVPTKTHKSPQKPTNTPTAAPNWRVGFSKMRNKGHLRTCMY